MLPTDHAHELTMTLRCVLMLLLAAAACRREAPVVAVTPIEACPPGAELVGDAPPKGLRQRCQKSESERHGASREWYADRHERSSSEWWNGVKHGRFTLWFENGRVRSTGAHRFGAPAGEWTYFAEDGTLRQTQVFPVAPPPADWLAQALAGHPPPDEPAPGAGDRAGAAAAEQTGGW
jgi:hypothetical protein